LPLKVEFFVKAKGVGTSGDIDLNAMVDDEFSRK
jgi:hypothetical protein